MRLRYIVDKEHGVVVCIGECGEFDLMKDLGILDKDCSNIDDIPLQDLFAYSLSSSFKGVAKLADGDVWDEQFGKDIAREKCFAKYNSAKKHKIEKLIEQTESVLECLNEHKKTYEALGTIEDYYKRLS